MAQQANTLNINNAILASEEFALIYNSARDELDIWLQTQDPATMTSALIRAKLKETILEYLELINGSQMSTGGCQGLVPVSTAGYDQDC